jgi:hypothetical protein
VNVSSTIDDDDNNKSKCTIQKEDIFIDPSNNDDDDEASCDSNLDYSHNHCIICLGAYKNGESICWSNNDSCHHSYHSNCILEWLSKHSECPQCREEYVLIGKQSSEQQLDFTVDEEQASA